MTEAGAQQNDDLRIAYLAALEARRETFLARLPRAFKLTVTALLLFGLAAPFVWPQSGGPVSEVERAAEGETAAPASGTPSLSQPIATPPAARHAPETEAEIAAAARNDSGEFAGRLPLAPDVGLVEEGMGGYLPKIGSDGRRPWQVYARPFDQADPRPRIAIVVGDLGLSRVATDAALRRLPRNMTLAFDVQGEATAAWIARAREDGFETLLSLPMEPFDYPRSDPGPNALLTDLPNSDNIQRLHTSLRQGVGYVGVTTLTGSRFTTETTKLTPVLETLRDRGLLIFDPQIAKHSAIKDSAKAMGLPVAVATRHVDANPAPAAIDAALAQLEQTARVEGAAVGVVAPLPVTFERLEVWAKQLGARGFALAPISAVVE